METQGDTELQIFNSCLHLHSQHLQPHVPFNLLFLKIIKDDQQVGKGGRWVRLNLIISIKNSVLAMILLIVEVCVTKRHLCLLVCYLPKMWVHVITCEQLNRFLSVCLFNVLPVSLQKK